MPNTLPKNVQKRVKEAVFRKADKFGYLSCGRIESGRFLDDLVEDLEVGAILIEYMPKERVRTYIKDGILNAYAKAATRSSLAALTPEASVHQVYGKEAVVIQKGKGKATELTVLRSSDGELFLISGGTVLKWETALRKALEVIASEPKLIVNNVVPNICLMLSVSGAITDADKTYICAALGAVGVRAIFLQ